MALAKLSKRAVEAMIPPKVGQDFLWDTDIRGLGVRIGITGVKTFVIQYTNEDRKHRRLKLGRYGIMTVEQARERAKIELGNVAAGKDPADTRDRARTTVGDVCDWYLEEAEAERLLGRKRKPVAPATLALDRSRIERHVKPLIGGKSVNRLSIADLERFQADIKEGKTAKDRDGRGGITTGGAGVAGRTIGMLHTIFEQAVRWGVLETNPARGIRKISIDVKRERRLSTDELKRFGEALKEFENESPVAVAAIRLILLTGFRRMEALALEWPWIDEAMGCVRFPDTKTGPQVRAIGAAAIAHIKAQPKREGCDYVFPSDVSDNHLVGLPRILDRVCAKADIDGVTAHVLRHTFASIAGELGFSELTIGTLLGHSPRGVTQRYVHIDQGTKLAADQVSNAIAGASISGSICA